MNYKTEEESFSAPEDEVRVYNSEKRKRRSFKEEIAYILDCWKNLFFPADEDEKSPKPK